MSGDGFAELARLDADGNGWVDEGDAAFAKLGVWRPDGGGIRSLAQAGVGALLASGVSSPFSLRSAQNAPLGEVRATGLYLTEEGAARPLQQIDLVV